MRNRKTKLCVALILGVGLLGVKAQQNLNVSTSSQNVSINTQGIRKLTFTDNNINICGQDGSVSTYALVNVDKLFFNNTPTIIPNEVASVSQIELFPNPVKDILNIKSSASDNCDCIVEILDLKGTILQRETLGSRNAINVSDLHKGIYICRVYYCDKIENIKILKN